MFDNEFSYEEVNAAFEKLKQFIYFDKNDLSLRARVSKFSNSNQLRSDLDQLVDVLNSQDIASSANFEKWLRGIRPRIVPKKIRSNADRREAAKNFITNRTTSKKYCVETVNYFFNGPVQLYIIAVLWIMREGQFLDKVLGAECFGSRLENISNSFSSKSPKLYQRYHSLYRRWRDSGIEKARHMLVRERKSVCILGLDIKEYYYHISIDFEEVAQVIAAGKQGVEADEVLDWEISPLLRAVERIGEFFKDIVSADMRATHVDVSPDAVGLPIGLLSSQLLANWYLKRLDDAVSEEVRPYYYGRYVDDILLVVPTPSNLSDSEPVESILASLFVKNKLLRDCGDGKYEIMCRPGLYLQKEKCILQHFDVDHSLAGLDKFQKTLELNSSEMLALPVEDADNSLEDVAYDILYEGSANKFRSVKGITENRYGLAKYLSRHTMLHLLTDDPQDMEVTSSVLNFFKGRNAIEFHDLWERVLALLFISENTQGFSRFYDEVLHEIGKIWFENGSVEEKLKRSMLLHLNHSRDLVLALGDLDEQSERSKFFRKANMVRHHLVRHPLINYTNYSGSLVARNIEKGVTVSNFKLRRSPRYINFDECMLLVMSGLLKNDTEITTTHEQNFKNANKIYQEANGFSHLGVRWSSNLRKDRNA